MPFPVPLAPMRFDHMVDRLQRDMPRSVRSGFVRKVYGILLSQMLLVFITTLVYVHKREWHFYIAAKPGFCYFISVCNAVFALAFANSPLHWLRTVPYNYVMLFLWSFTCGIMMGILTCSYNSQIHLMMLPLMAAVANSWSLCTTTVSYRCRYVWSVILAFSLCRGVRLVAPDPLVDQHFAIFFIYLVIIYLTYHTQVLVDGEGGIYSVDDYVLGALTVHLDVFAHLVRKTWIKISMIRDDHANQETVT